MSAKIFSSYSKIIEETPDTKRFVLHPVQNTIPISNFLTLMPVIEGIKVCRSYSRCPSSNRDASIAVTSKRVANGPVSKLLMRTM
jgi:ring-1,2-phenylacetyl-CoA epoxidase subunit PaaE